MDAKQYIQRCYNAVGLPDQLDVHRRYSYLFNDWSAKLVESVKPQVHIMVNRRFMAKRMVSHIWTDELKDITLGEEVTRVNLARDAVPWVILAAHILLDYTADALEIATSLVDTFHIHGISQSTIEQVVAWSLYPMGLDYNVDLGNSKTRQEQLKYAAANESRLSEKRTEIWRRFLTISMNIKRSLTPKSGLEWSTLRCIDCHKITLLKMILIDCTPSYSLMLPLELSLSPLRSNESSKVLGQSADICATISIFL